MSQGSALSVGQRVRHRHDQRLGVITDLVEVEGTTVCTVAFPDGEWDLEDALLEPLRADIDPSKPIQFNPHRAWLRREGLRLADAYRNDPSAALSNSRIEPKSHQISVALRALSKSQPRLILADEVGLGKTIEAGLILKELRARNVLDRVLIMCPANLVTQWQQELSRKFNEHFVYSNSERLKQIQEARGPDHNPWSSGSNVICSLQYARGDNQREDIAAAPWDLAIVDEAHHARRHYDSGPNKGYELLEAMRDRVPGFLLLTATPMQLHDYELYSMVELVAPGLFDNYEDFVDSRTEIAELNGHIEWLRKAPGDHDRSRELYECLRDSDAPDDVVGLHPARPEERAKLIAWAETRHRLSDALVRNRKSEVGGFTQRVARRIPVEPSREETELELDVHEYIQRVYRASPAQGLVLVTFRKILASSSDALAGALERRAGRLLDHAIDSLDELTDDEETASEIEQALAAVSTAAVEAEVAELEDMARRARAIVDSKLEGLDRALNRMLAEAPSEKVLIFTQFIGTLEMIQRRLSNRFNVVAFHGGMSIAEKDAAARAFQGDAQVMVSSEAGGEGRNFQFCHVQINYDLPWNPMKVEQRIGRLDRVGQKNDVYIYNFELRGTLDAQILDVLEHRIQIFSETVGALDPILGDVEKQIEQIYLLDPEAALEEFTRFELDLDTKLHRARERDEQFRDFLLDSRSFRRDEVNELLGTPAKATPRDIERFVRAALRPYPTAKISEGDSQVIRIELPAAIVQRARQEVGARLATSWTGTFDHETAIAHEDVDFFAFGHQLIDGLFAYFSQELDEPVCALASEDGAHGVVFDYRVRFGGVRQRDWMLSHLVAADGVMTAPELPAPVATRRTLESHQLPGDGLDAERERSRAAADEQIAAEFEDFASSNEVLMTAERDRIEKLYDFQVRFLTSRIENNQRLIDLWEALGSEAERRTIPARRGLIRADEERIARVEDERHEKLRELEQLRAPTREMTLTGTTVLV